MKANQSEATLSPLDISRLTPGTIWKDEDGVKGVILAVNNKSVPKEHRALFPLSVTYTSNFKDVFAVPVKNFIDRMTFVEESKEAAGYIQSSWLALGALLTTGEQPTIQVASEEKPVEAKDDTGTAPAGAPVEFLFNENVSEMEAAVIASNLAAFTDNGASNVLELAFTTNGGATPDLYKRAMVNLVHIDTDAEVYSGDWFSAVSVNQSFVKGPDGNFHTLVAVYIELNTDQEEETESTVSTEELREAMDAVDHDRQRQASELASMNGEQPTHLRAIDTTTGTYAQ